MRKVGPTNGPSVTRSKTCAGYTPHSQRRAPKCSTSARTALGCQRALSSSTSAQVLTATGGWSGPPRAAQSDQKSDQRATELRGPITSLSSFSSRARAREPLEVPHAP